MNSWIHSLIPGCLTSERSSSLLLPPSINSSPESSRSRFSRWRLYVTLGPDPIAASPNLSACYCSTLVWVVPCCHKINWIALGLEGRLQNSLSFSAIEILMRDARMRDARIGWDCFAVWSEWASLRFTPTVRICLCVTKMKAHRSSCSTGDEQKREYPGNTSSSRL